MAAVWSCGAGLYRSNNPQPVQRGTFCLLKGGLCLHKVLKVVARKRLQCDPEGSGSLSYPVKIEHEVSTLIIEGPIRDICNWEYI